MTEEIIGIILVALFSFIIGLEIGKEFGRLK